MNNDQLLEGIQDQLGQVRAQLAVFLSTVPLDDRALVEPAVSALDQTQDMLLAILWERAAPKPWDLALCLEEGDRA